MRTVWARALVLALALAAALPLSARAQEWIPRRRAELQLLDKVTARVSVVQAEVGDPVEFGTLSILVRSCSARPTEEVPDAAAWLQVRDLRRPTELQLVFQGWMFASNPAVNMLEHPVYDLRVLACQ